LLSLSLSIQRKETGNFWSDKQRARDLSDKIQSEICFHQLTGARGREREKEGERWREREREEGERERERRTGGEEEEEWKVRKVDGERKKLFLVFFVWI
jgi:hypothetical protein